MKHMKIRKLLAGGLAAAMCLLSGCAGLPDSKEDPLSGHNVDALLPFETRLPNAAATATPTPFPSSTSIVNLPQNWQNEPAPESDKSTNAPTTAPTVYRPSYTYSRLEQGDTGDEVMRLQNRLIQLGYLTGTADGTFGANTKTAVKLFQKTLGLSQTGVATVSLQEKLFISSAPVYTVQATLAPDTQQGSQALVRGDTGNAVIKLQQRLIQLGYLSGTADGKFGAKTENAIKAFQAQLGLAQTGVASVSLQNQLYAGSAPYAPEPTRAPTQIPTQIPTRTPTLPPVSSGYQQLEPGDKSPEVANMQTRLRELGYLSSTSTGNYYAKTTEAVKLFQQAVGLEASGIATVETLTRLYAANAPYYSAGSAPAPTQAVTGYTTLAYGSKGNEVLNLQKRLIELGYLTGTADGSFGSATEQAVQLFQNAVGYNQNGIASIGLQNILFSANAPVYRPVFTPTPLPTQIPTSAPAQSAYRQLNPGDSGDEVKMLQTRLKQLGFFSGVLGGNYLTKTTDAVRLFQAAIGHAQTGVATPEMQEILFSDDAPDYASVESEYVTLEKNDSGIQVLYLQQRLIELGWLSGSADGDFGSKTENAVKAFQEAAGLDVTGKATAQTQQILFSGVAPYAPVPTQIPTQVPTQAPTQTPTQVPAQSPTQPPFSGSYVQLAYGASGDDVKSLQTRLRDLGYFSGVPGGNYLRQTEEAVKLFQATIGYPQDGVATSDLQTLIFSGSAPAYNGSALIELSEGSKGPAVRRLQQRLIDLKYLTSSTADGDFGSGTTRAFKRFQAAVGYEIDGIATIELQNLLFSEYAPVYNSQPTDVPAAPTQAPAQPPAETAAPQGPRDLAQGAEGEDVRRMQQRLIELGYLSGGADGDFGSGTERAVIRFQKAIGWTQDGVASVALQDYLFSASAPIYVPEETQAPASPSYPTLSHGSTGEDVKAIQRRLKELGFFNGDIGGNYLTKTETAVKLFQAAIGFEQDGVATPALQEILFSSAAPSYSDTPSVDPSTPARPEQLTILVRGDSGSSVKLLQQRLIQLGWLTGSADGDFGEATELAINAFLFRMGFEADGVAGIEIQELLYSETAPAYVEYIELLPGAEGDEVLAVQKRLIELGYLEATEVNMDGIYGTSLQNALIAFERDTFAERLPDADPETVTFMGIASVELQTFLFSKHADKYIILP